jgi:hypothetical protein
MSSSSDNSKLIATAIGAAVAGAAMGVATMKLLERNAAKQSEFPMETLAEGRKRVSSTIFEDPYEKGSNPDTIVFPHNHEEKMRRRVMARALVEEDNVMPRNSVTVRVPATSANMGPGCE